MRSGYKLRKKNMKAYFGNIEKETLENNNFRKVLFTGPQSQLVVMSLKPGEEIGKEIHDNHDQFIRIEEGKAEVIVDGETRVLNDDEVVVIPAGAEHNVINASEAKDLKLYTIYSPAEHPEGTVHQTKAEADQAEH